MLSSVLLLSLPASCSSAGVGGRVGEYPSSGGAGRREHVGSRYAAGAGAGVGGRAPTAGADKEAAVPRIDPRRQKVSEDRITPELLKRCKTPQLVLELTSGMTVVDKHCDGWERQTEQAYREAALRYHPDRNKLRVEWADLVFKMVAEAKMFIFTTGKRVSQK
jgi:hypothetical protein